MVRLIIFDLDGTLLDSLGDLAEATNYALREFGFPEHEWESYRYFVGDGVSRLVERALPEEERSADMVAAVSSVFEHYYLKHKMDRTCPYAGIVELLDKLRERGVLLAVASNKFDAATQVLVSDYFGEGRFAFVVGQRSGVPTKPAPDIVDHILDCSGISRDEVVYVGDSGVDMQTAANVGVYGVGVTWGFRTVDELWENGARFVAKSPAEILRFVDERNDIFRV